MSPISTRLYSLVFLAVYSCYWIARKLNYIVDRIVRLVYLSYNKAGKIEQTLHGLQKIPHQVILAIEVKPNSLNQDKKINALIQDIIACFETIKLAKVERVCLFLWGIDYKQASMLELMLKDSQLGNQMQVVQFLQFDQFYRTLHRESLEWNKKSVPLLISMGSYQSLNCIPFSHLIDTQFVFCPPVSECLQTDIQKCFEQYATTQQRHGR